MMDRPKNRVSDDIRRVERARELNAGKPNKQAEALSTPPKSNDDGGHWTKVRK